MRTRASVGVLALTLLAIALFLVLSTRGQAAGPAQPIAFNHQVHAAQYKIDCQYCHADARRSEYAGIPSVSRCMGCHKITAADRPEVQKLAGFFTEGPVTDFASAKRSDTARYAKFFHAMLARGVFLAASQFEAAFVSLAHSEADIETAAQAARQALRAP